MSKHKEKRRSYADEPHWSKILQTNISETSPTKQNSLFARFLQWIKPREHNSTPNLSSASASHSNSTTPSKTPDSIAHNSETHLHIHLHNNNNMRSSYSQADLIPSTLVLKEPSSSTIMIKRNLERLHRVHKPIPIFPDGNELTKRPAQQIEKRRSPGCQPKQPQATSPNKMFLGENLLSANRKSPLTTTVSCPSKQAAGRQSVAVIKRPLIGTWPPSGYHITIINESDEENDIEITEKYSERHIRHLQEFTITYEDITVETCISSNLAVHTFQGKWHGNVIVQEYGEEWTAEFWKDVKKLSKIRHENIALFMGACTKPGHLAIVTSECFGCSLYERLHIKRDRLTLQVRMNYIYHITQGLAYLHAKNIVYGLCASRNVFIERAKIKLSVVDYSHCTNTPMSPSSKSFSSIKSNLLYLSPEILERYYINKSDQSPFVEQTMYSDVYSLGMLMYEIVAICIPYENIPYTALPSQICAGRRPPLSRVTAPPHLKELIEECWKLPAQRPSCREILRILQKKYASISKRLSSSDPERMNKHSHEYF